MKVIAEKVTVHPGDIPFHLYNDVCVMKKPACVSGIKTLNRYFTLKPRDEIEQDLLIEIMSENETSLTIKHKVKFVFMMFLTELYLDDANVKIATLLYDLTIFDLIAVSDLLDLPS